MRFDMSFLGLLTIILISKAYGADAVQFKKVEFQMGNITYQCQQIIPGEKHYLNQIAKSAAQEIDGLQILNCPNYLEAAKAKGAYAFSKHVLLVSESVLTDDVAGPVLRHELVHARLWSGLRKGTPYAFNGIVFNTRPEFQGRQYGRAFGLDETMATLFSVNFFAQTLKSELVQALTSTSMSAFSGVVEAGNEMRVYTARLKTMLTTLTLGIQTGSKKALEKTPPELAFLQETYKWQEVATDEIRIILPLGTSAQTINVILEFAKETILKIDKIDESAAKLQILVQTSNSQLAPETEKIIKSVDELLATLKAKFPAEALIIEKSL
ncbi:MAG: hypothetical protein V4736_11490 [Bdellovibrionota bacterium]